MTHGETIDRHALHVYLWNQRDRRGQICIPQHELAEELGISIYTMSRIFKEMKDAGRVKKISGAKHNVGRYVVNNPAPFKKGRAHA